MNVWKQLRFLQNMRISWKTRVVIDTVIIFTPFYILWSNPFTLFEPFKEGHRRNRRATIADVDLDTAPDLMTPDQVVDFYQSLGFEDPL